MDDMDNASVIDAARSIATAAHIGQVDKTGHSYIEHPTRVAERVVALFPDAPPEVVAAALLHDVIEDTPVIDSDLIAAGIPASVVEAVEAVTKREGEPVERYFARVRSNPWAVMVKTADIADNTDPARVAQLDPETRDRLHTKYTRARALLHLK
jgi:(p)ppGpp synthase/HD superfamily hydrolase